MSEEIELTDEELEAILEEEALLDEIAEEMAATLEGAMKMVETSDERITMVEEPVSNNLVEPQEAPVVGQTQVKMRLMREEKPHLKLKYMGKAKPY